MRLEKDKYITYMFFHEELYQFGFFQNEFGSMCYSHGDEWDDTDGLLILNTHKIFYI